MLSRFSINPPRLFAACPCLWWKSCGLGALSTRTCGSTRTRCGSAFPSCSSERLVRSWFFFSHQLVHVLVCVFAFLLVKVLRAKFLKNLVCCQSSVVSPPLFILCTAFIWWMQRILVKYPQPRQNLVFILVFFPFWFGFVFVGLLHFLFFYHFFRYTPSSYPWTLDLPLD